LPGQHTIVEESAGYNQGVEPLGCEGMCFSGLLQLPLPTAGLVDTQAKEIKDQDPCPPPSKFQRKCKTQVTALSEPPSKIVAAQHRNPHAAIVRYVKNPIGKSELCPAHATGYTIEESVQIFEDMLDMENEILDGA
jgi:hypothetical protein